MSLSNDVNRDAGFNLGVPLHLGVRHSHTLARTHTQIPGQAIRSYVLAFLRQTVRIPLLSFTRSGLLLQ